MRSHETPRFHVFLEPLIPRLGVELEEPTAKGGESLAVKPADRACDLLDAAHGERLPSVKDAAPSRPTDRELSCEHPPEQLSGEKMPDGRRALGENNARGSSAGTRR